MEFCQADRVVKEISNILAKAKNRVNVVNIPRYAEVLQAVKQLILIIKENSHNVHVNIEADGLTGTSLCLEFTTEMLNIYEVKQFCECAHLADTMCAYPTTDDKICVGFTFEDIKIPLSTTE